MTNERPNGYNVGWEIVGDSYISTAAVVTSSPYMGYYFIYETIIWDWNGEIRGDIKQQITHKNKAKAMKVHGYIVNNMKMNEK